LATDRQSAFGGVMAFNRPVDRELAEQLNAMFVELAFAPGFAEDALEILQQKPNVRLLSSEERREPPLTEQDIKRVRGGVLVQDRDTGSEDRADMQVVTERKPSEREWGENAIVLAKDLATAGVGAGQMSRVDSVRLAVEKAGAARIDLAGASLASDAFFPFADGPEYAIEAGVQTIIQPGGSQRDAEVIEACDRAGVAMVFTARRHFRH
jgi:phosphoribosylaminoimidazolecarboxamide formyltransferase/IMP cyclohydrolase